MTSQEVADWYQEFHERKGVSIITEMNVERIDEIDDGFQLFCSNGGAYEADLIIIGTGIKVNQRLASEAGLNVGNGIEVNAYMQSSDPDIYAIGDCSWHENKAYKGKMRLESVQNAVEQAKVAAGHIVGKEKAFHNIPWFWSDQFDAKLQMVGIMDGYDEILVRKESPAETISVWFFQGEKLLAVHAINQPRSYMLGTKLIKSGEKVNKEVLINPEIALTPSSLIG